MSHMLVKPPGDEVLRKIGRSVVNFQKLEHALRNLIPLASLSGSSDEMQTSSRRKAKALRKKAFGEVVKRFDSAFYGDDVALEPDVEPTEVRLSLSIKLEGGAGSEAQRRELIALVRERNRLVHYDLFGFDFASESECHKLALRLDAQNERILAQLTFIRSIRDSHTSAVAELAAFVESNEFLELLGAADGDT